MTVYDRFVSEMLALSLALNTEANPPVFAKEGVAIGGSYNQSDGTIEVVIGDTLSLIQDGNLGSADPLNPIAADRPMVVRAPLATTHLGDQYGPVGNERVMLLPTQSGYLALLHHDEDDSPQAPLGERWITHRNPQTGHIDAFFKLTNNGAPSDDLGGVTMLLGSRAEMKTASGFGFVLDDESQTATISTPGGLSIVLDDAAGKVFVGKPGLAQPDSIVTQSDAQTLANAIIAAAQTALDSLAATVQGGSGVAAPTIGSVTAKGSSIADSAE